MHLKLFQKEQFKVENRFLENTGILLKATTEKIISQERGFLSKRWLTINENSTYDVS